MSNTWYGDYMKDFNHYIKLLVPHIERSFSVKINWVNKEYLKSITKTDFPIQGLFNDKYILLLDKTPLEKQLFIMIHIVGHYMQWQKEQAEKDYSFSFQEDTDFKNSEEIDKHHKHEIDSVKYSLDYLHEKEIFEMDDWFTNLFKKDQEYINNYFETKSIQETIGNINNEFIYVL